MSEIIFSKGVGRAFEKKSLLWGTYAWDIFWNYTMYMLLIHACLIKNILTNMFCSGIDN